MLKIGKENGQSIIVVTLVLTGLIAMMGLAIDGGMVYYRHREMQNAADASAFAGGKAILDPANSAKDRAAECAIRRKIEQFAIANGITGSQTDANCNTLNSNINAYFITQDGSQVGTTLGRNYYVPTTATGVCVTDQNTSPTFFMGVMGINSTKTSAIGCVNSINSVCGGGYTLWAGSTTCDGGSQTAIYINGANNTFGGASHSNNKYWVNGNNNNLGNVSTVNGFIDQANHGTIVNVTTSAVQPYPVPFQTYFNNGDYAPGGRAAVAAGANYHYVNGNKTWSLNGEVINGLWYINGNAKLAANQESGNLTIIATGTIEIGGNGQNNNHPPDFTPYADGLLLYSNYHPTNVCEDNKTINLNGNNIYYDGIIFAPYGEVYLNGNNGNTLHGTLIGNTVYVNGNNSILNYDSSLTCGSSTTVITKPK